MLKNSLLLRKYVYNVIKKPIDTSKFIKSSKELSFTSLRTLSNSMMQYNDDKNLGSTTVLLQDGVTIQELPCIVQIINGDFVMHSNGLTNEGRRYEGLGLEIVEEQKIIKRLDIAEEHRIFLSFFKCKHINQLKRLIDKLPEEKLTPQVATTAIRRLLNIQASKSENVSASVKPVMKRLIKVVTSSKDPELTIDVLLPLSRTMTDDKSLVEPLCLEALIQITEGKADIIQMCKIVKYLQPFEFIKSKFNAEICISITNHPQNLTNDEILHVASILPLMKESTNTLFKFMEKKADDIWYDLKPHTIEAIVRMMVRLDINSTKMLTLISKWLNVNTHLVTELELRLIVYTFSNFDFTDNNIQRALTRYMKAKSSHVLNLELVGVILDYCVKMRYHSPEILNGASELFVRKSRKLAATDMGSFIRAFGILNYEPPNSHSLFIRIEKMLHSRTLLQFPADTIVDIVLSCIFLDKFPKNFVKHLFTSDFFEKSTKLNPIELRKTLIKLKVIDIAFTLECPTYKGPYLPLDKGIRSQNKDGRIVKCIQNIQTFLIEIAGSSERISTNVHIPNMPSADIYSIDILIDMSGRISIPYFKWGKNKYALLIHLPEQYTTGEVKLIGPQRMRIRHLKKFGFKVVGLDYRILHAYRMYPEKLKSYIQNEMSKTNALKI